MNLRDQTDGAGNAANDFRRHHIFDLNAKAYIV
jgi:hypothetical protein